MGPPARILVVDDEPQIRRFLVPALEASGYEALTADSGGEALRLAAAMTPAAIILDLGLPDIDGLAVIARIRRWSAVPIIVLTARAGEADIVAALDSGANDYVPKPFGIGELLARLRAALRDRRPDEASPDRLEPGSGVTIDRASRVVTVRGAPVHLTPKEFDLLALLALTPGRVLTHRMLLTRVWGPAHGEDSPYLRVFIAQLRAKIEADAARPAILLTEPGVGYKFAARDG